MCLCKSESPNNHLFRVYECTRVLRTELEAYVCTCFVRTIMIRFAQYGHTEYNSKQKATCTLICNTTSCHWAHKLSQGQSHQEEMENPESSRGMSTSDTTAFPPSTITLELKLSSIGHPSWSVHIQGGIATLKCWHYTSWMNLQAHCFRQKLWKGSPADEMSSCI